MLSYTKSRLTRQSWGNAGKTLIQTLFFFLLVTQICFAQLLQQNKITRSKQNPRMLRIDQMTIGHRQFFQKSNKYNWLRKAHSQFSKNIILENKNDGPPPTWVRNYINPTDPSNSQFNDVVVDKDGNIYAGGQSEDSFPRNPVGLIIKYNSSGEVQWIVRDKTVGALTMIDLDSLGNVYVVGSGIAKFNTLGVKQWEVDSVWAWASAVDAQGNVFVTTSIGAEIQTTKYNTNGVYQWLATLAVGTENYVEDIAVDATGGAIITGNIYSPTMTSKIITVKYLADGTEQWRAIYGTAAMWGNRVAYGDSGYIYVLAGKENSGSLTLKYNSGGILQWVAQTSGFCRGLALGGNDNVIVATAAGGVKEWNAVKYDQNGLQKWTRKFNDNYDGPAGIALDKDGNIYFVSTSDSANQPRMEIISLDENGSIRYELSYPSFWGNALKVDSNGNFYVLGWSLYKGFVLKLNSSGTQKWLTTYKGPKVPMDAAADIGLDSSGNIYVCGTRPEFQLNSTGCFVLKYDPKGNLLWKRVADSSSWNGAEQNPEMKVNADGSTAVLYGYLSLSSFSSDGDLLWSIVTPTPSVTWWGQKEGLLTDGNEDIYTLSSTTLPWYTDSTTKTLVQKFSKGGVPLWTSELVGRFPISAAMDKGGGLSAITIPATGDSNVPSVTTYDETGNLLWSTKLDQSEESNLSVRDIAVDDSGSVYVIGAVYLSPPNRDYFLTAKLDKTGSHQWIKVYDEGNDFSEDPKDVAIDKNGNIFIAGCKTLVSYDTFGNKRWMTKAPYDGGWISKMFVDRSGDLYVGYSGFRIVKYSNNGAVLWTASYSNPDWSFVNSDAKTSEVTKIIASSLAGGWGGGFGGSEVGFDIDGKGHLFVTGSFGSAFFTDMGCSPLSSVITTVCYDISTTTVVDRSNENPQIFNLFQNYPNPFNPSTKIIWQLPVGGNATLKVYNILGREVATLVNEYKPAGNYETEFNAAALPSGVYFYQLKAGEYINTKKMILLR
jgi:sugar lactone lactonase YvrE